MVNLYLLFLAPLHRLLEKHTSWTWGTEQQQAFDKVKALLTSDTVLAHYDSDKPLLLACDASPYGIGAVLSHAFEDGSERPVAYASHTLGPAGKRYSHFDKEELAIMFGVKRFHQYLAGRNVTSLSDHKPLQHLFQETSGIPTLASARIWRWALVLSAYNYSLHMRMPMSSAGSLSLTVLHERHYQVRSRTQSVFYSLSQIQLRISAPGPRRTLSSLRFASCWSPDGRTVGAQRTPSTLNAETSSASRTTVLLSRPHHFSQVYRPEMESSHSRPIIPSNSTSARPHTHSAPTSTPGVTPKVTSARSITISTP